MTLINPDKLRDDTPACRDLIHFNNAGASLQPLPVTLAEQQHLALEQQLGGYEAAIEHAAASTFTYTALAKLLNCQASEIACVESATRAFQLLITAIPLSAGDRILVNQSEYSSNYMTLLHLARTRQIQLAFIPNDASGQIDLAVLQKQAKRGASLILLTHIPSQTGTIQPAAAVGEIARQFNIPYLLDACQSVGHLHLDVDLLGCDMLVASGRKYLRAPRGTGFLYIKEALAEQLTPAAIDLHSATWLSPDQYELAKGARRFESWEHDVAARIALGVAADYALAIGMPVIEGRIRALAAKLRDQLSQVSGVIIDDQGKDLSGIVTFHIKGRDAGDVASALRQAGINTSVVRRQNTQLDHHHRQLPDINRASLHAYNTDEEIARFCEVMQIIINAG
jgi:selenocysteine lyase/cysteine desulfurase